MISHKTPYYGINERINRLPHVHSGSWWGLPDFGVTEAIGSWFGSPRTAQGGSNVLGASTSNTSTGALDTSGNPVSLPPVNYNQVPYPTSGVTWDNQTTTPTSGGTGVISNNTGSGTSAPSGSSEEELRIQALRNEIGSAWDSYLNSLGGVESNLANQRTAQENLANTQLTSGQNTINTQRASSLRDIAGNMKNAFQAGNIYLGARGAGDSSAANQYQFALSKEAGKQTGQLNEFVNGQLNNLQSNYDAKVQEIASWFYQQQNALKQMIASGQLSKAQDINNLSRSLLDNAINMKNQLLQGTQSRYNALVEWAANNSNNIQQLTSNIAAIPQAMGGPQIDSRGNFVVPTGTGVGNSTTENKNIFSFTNPSWF